MLWCCPCVQMLSAGLQPNLVTYNTLLEVYAKRGMWREAVGVLDTLEQQVWRAAVASTHVAAAIKPCASWCHRVQCAPCRAKKHLLSALFLALFEMLHDVRGCWYAASAFLLCNAWRLPLQPVSRQ